MIGIINYGAGNLFSLKCALERIGTDFCMISTPEEFAKADKYIIPGVGHAGTAMQKLNSTDLVPLLRATDKPLLGICLGMQLLTEYSEEGNCGLLSMVPLNTKLFREKVTKVPQMGWNTVTYVNNHPLFKGILNESYFYFVHSYFVEYNDEYTIGKTEYGIEYSSAIQKENYMGVQFHPEKSGKAGEQLLANFAGL